MPRFSLAMSFTRAGPIHYGHHQPTVVRRARQRQCGQDIGIVPCAATRYTAAMIVSFRHKGLETLYRTGSARGVQAAHASKLKRILAALDTAATATELNQPGYKLHPLKGSLKGHWSIWVSGNWRVTFRFVGADVELVDYQDFH